MKLIVGFVTAIITVVLTLSLIFLSKKKTMVNKIESSMLQIHYLLLITLPIICLTFVCDYITINPFIFSILWLLIFLAMDKLFTRKIFLITNTKKKMTVIFLSLLLCVFYFIAKGIAEWSCEYLGMISVAGALIVGFFIPLDVVLSDTYIKNKCFEIWKGIGLNCFEKTTFYIYIMIVVFFVFSVVIDNTKFAQVIWISILGAEGIVGVIILPMLKPIMPKDINDSIKGCTDYRKKIFDSQIFLDYQRDIEEKLKLSNQEFYDYVEAFLFYRAFSSKEENRILISETAECKLYETLKNDSTVLSNYKLYLKKKKQKYILKNGHKEYSFECLVNTWAIFLEYIQSFSEIELEDGDVPKEYKAKYEAWGYVNEEEKWLLFFLEKYHCLSRKDRKHIVPDELKTLVYYEYREQALWIVPTRLITYMYSKNNKEIYSYGDITLAIAYEWFKRKKNGENTREYLREILEKEFLVNAVESWLGEYTDWELFVISNRLRNLVNKKISLSSYGFLEPKKIVNPRLNNGDNKKVKKKWMRCLKETTNMFCYRY